MKNILPWALLAIAVIAYVIYNKGLLTKLNSPSVIQEMEIESSFLERIVKIWVYLPPNYLKTEEKLPVLYMNDGQNLFDEKLSFAGEWKVDEALDSLYNETGYQLVVVGIENGGEKRLDELTPYPNEKYGGGNADLYLSFIEEELLPEIESKFNVSNQKANRGIMGSSLGGLITFYAAFEKQELFSKFGVYSPSFWFNDKIFELAQNQQLSNDSRMLMMMGDQEEGEHLNVQKMDSILKKTQNIQLKTEIIADGVHNEKFWATQFKDDVAWLFEMKK